MKTGVGDIFKKDKVRKDRFDIISIISSCEIRPDLLLGIVKEHGFGECFKHALERAISDPNAIDRHGFNEENQSDLEEKVNDIITDI